MLQCPQSAHNISKTEIACEVVKRIKYIPHQAKLVMQHLWFPTESWSSWDSWMDGICNTCTSYFVRNLQCKIYEILEVIKFSGTRCGSWLLQIQNRGASDSWILILDLEAMGFWILVSGSWILVLYPEAMGFWILVSVSWSQWFRTLKPVVPGSWSHWFESSKISNLWFSGHTITFHRISHDV